MLKHNITFGRALTTEDLKQILQLQKQNLPANLSENEKRSDGFVTVQHSLDVLRKMNDACPHVIAKHDHKIVGYALCMLNDFREDVPVLEPMFKYMDSIIEKKNLSNSKYLIMGQVCVHKDYRKQGIFRGLYNKMKTELQSDFDFLITEVNTKNRRSSQAHKAIGFEVLDTHTAKGENWELIILSL